MKLDLLALVQQRGEDARIIKTTSSGRNALGLHMPCCLGRLWPQEPDACFHVIAKDTRMAPPLGHFRETGIGIWRWADGFQIQIVK